MHIKNDDDAPGLTSRILGALMAFAFSTLSVIYLPLFVVWKLPVYVGLSLGFPAVFLFSAICLWGLVVGGASLVIGFRAGVYDTMDIFNVMWRTGDAYDPKIHERVLMMKKIIVVSALLTLVLLCLE